MTEDYAIRIRTGRAVPTGKFETTRRGTVKPILAYAEEYQTKAGTFSPGIWKEKALEAVKAENKLALLDKVKSYCKEHCAWLHTENELEEYALDCLCEGTYSRWPDFRGESI